MLSVRHLSTANVRVAIFHISPISWVIAASSHVTTENALGAKIGAIFVNRKCSWCDNWCDLCQQKMLLVRYLSTEMLLRSGRGADMWQDICGNKVSPAESPKIPSTRIANFSDRVRSFGVPKIQDSIRGILSTGLGRAQPCTCHVVVHVERHVPHMSYAEINAERD